MHAIFYLTTGDLCKYLQQMKCGLGNDRAVKYAKHITKAVQIMHQNNICHLDLSLENLLFDKENDCIKICGLYFCFVCFIHTIVCKFVIDFGLSRRICKGLFESASIRPGKKSYMAPEIYSYQRFDGRKADVFSLGVIFFILLTGFPPFNEPQATDQCFRHMFYDRKLKWLCTEWKLIPNVLNNDFIDLLSKIFITAKNRISIEDILDHPWMTTEYKHEDIKKHSILKIINNDNNNCQIEASHGLHISSDTMEDEILSLSCQSMSDNNNNIIIIDPLMISPTREQREYVLQQMQNQSSPHKQQNSISIPSILEDGTSLDDENLTRVVSESESSQMSLVSDSDKYKIFQTTDNDNNVEINNNNNNRRHSFDLNDGYQQNIDNFSLFQSQTTISTFNVAIVPKNKSKKHCRSLSMISTNKKVLITRHKTRKSEDLHLINSSKHVKSITMSPSLSPILTHFGDNLSMDIDQSLSFAVVADICQPPLFGTYYSDIQLANIMASIAHVTHSSVPLQNIKNINYNNGGNDINPDFRVEEIVDGVQTMSLTSAVAIAADPEYDIFQEPMISKD